MSKSRKRPGKAPICCTPVSLPPEQWADAARTALAENPANLPNPALFVTAFNLILEPDHLAVLATKYWGAGGVKLTVGFLESIATDLRNRILNHMNAWSQWANVEFVWTQTSPEVRITRSGSGYWSYLGTDVRHIATNQPTMCLQGFTMSTPESEFIRVVRHETGHTLGFPHEHLRRELVARIDPQKAIAYFGRTQGWSAAMVRSQVLTPLEESSLLGTPHADQSSIMCYQLPGSLTVDGKPILGGNDIDQDDIVAVAKLYPKAVSPPPPPPPVAGQTSITLKFAPGPVPDFECLVSKS